MFDYNVRFVQFYYRKKSNISFSNKKHEGFNMAVVAGMPLKAGTRKGMRKEELYISVYYFKPRSRRYFMYYLSLYKVSYKSIIIIFLTNVLVNIVFKIILFNLQTQLELFQNSLKACGLKQEVLFNIPLLCSKVSDERTVRVVRQFSLLLFRNKMNYAQ